MSGENKPLWAVNPDGSKKWEFSTKAQSLSAPVIGTNGTIYQTSFGGSFGDSKLYALTPDGRKMWEFQTERIYELGNNPAIGKDGTIFISGSSRLKDGTTEYLGTKSPIYAINPDGTKKWELTLDGYNLCDLAIGQNGTIYLNAYSRKTLYAINPDGSKKWEFRHENLVEEAPSIATDGTIYLGGQNFYAINPDGTLKWVLESKNLTCPVIGLDGTLYSASSNGDIYALNSDGTTQWVFGNRAGGTAPPTIGANGIIYFGSRDHGLYAIDSDPTKMGKAGSQ